MNKDYSQDDFILDDIEAEEWGIPMASTASSHAVCSCGAHEYYDNWSYGIFPSIGSFFALLLDYLWNIRYKVYSTCFYCDKIDILFRRIEVGNHTDCLPF